MKKILLLLLILPALACAFANPIENLGAGVSTETAIPSPAPMITPTIAGTASPEICKVIAGVLNLRDAPTTAGHVIAWLYEDDQITILPDPPVGDWRKVMTADKLTGWINSQYCER